MYWANVSIPTEPTSFKMASQNPIWIHAMQQEIDALEANHIWELTLSAGQKTIGATWIRSNTNLMARLTNLKQSL